MRDYLETNLMYIRFYKNFNNDPIETLFGYHSRRYDEDDNLIDVICFSSPSRCNLYGTNLTKITQINHSENEDDIYEFNEYSKISGFIDFLIYHQFNTINVDLNKTLDDKNNFKKAYDECESILSLYRKTMLPESYDYITFKIEEGSFNDIKLP